MLHMNKLRTVLLVLAVLAATATVAQAATKIHWYGQSAFRSLRWIRKAWAAG